jgi:hypothetical protein
MTYSDMQEEDDGCGDDRDDLEQDEQNVSRARRYLFRLTTFHLKYDKNDDLTAGSSRRVRYYSYRVSGCPKQLYRQCRRSRHVASSRHHATFPTKSTVNSTSNG